jgi:hypothetical protein
VLYLSVIAVVCVALFVLLSPREMRKLAAWLDARADTKEYARRMMRERLDAEFLKRGLTLEPEKRGVAGEVEVRDSGPSALSVLQPMFSPKGGRYEQGA